MADATAIYLFLTDRDAFGMLGSCTELVAAEVSTQTNPSISESTSSLLSFVLDRKTEDCWLMLVTDGIRRCIMGDVMTWERGLGRNEWTTDTINSNNSKNNVIDFRQQLLIIFQLSWNASTTIFIKNKQPDALIARNRSESKWEMVPRQRKMGIMCDDFWHVFFSPKFYEVDP